MATLTKDSKQYCKKNHRQHTLMCWFSTPDVTEGVLVVRLSLGKLLVNQLQVVKRTNTPLIP